VFTVKNAGSGVVTLDPDGAELIDGVTTKDIQPDGSLTVFVDAEDSEWVTANQNYGTTNDQDMIYTGKSAYPDDGELTISSGAVTITGVNHTIDTEADASTDDLDTINGGVDGEILMIRAENAARDVVIKSGTGNITTDDGEDITLDETEKVTFLQYDAALSSWLVVSRPVSVPGIPYGYIGGLTIANGTDSDHDIDISIGACRDSSDSADITLSAVLTKQIDVNWVAGDDAGGFPSGLSLNSSTWYHVFVILSSDGTVDGGFDTSLTATNLLSDATGYTEYRRLGSVLTDGSSNILAFLQNKDYFAWSSPPLDVSTSLNTTATSFTLSVPTGVACLAHITTNATSGTLVDIREPSLTDLAPSQTAAPLSIYEGPTASRIPQTTFVLTNTSSQIEGRASGATTTFRVVTRGYIDSREN